MSLVNQSGVTVSPENYTNTFFDHFKSYTNGVNWTQSVGSGDIIQLDGTLLGSSYLVISKDPLSNNTESSITSIATYDMPYELIAGISMSQRALGQEFSMELVSSDTTATINDIAISSIQQATTTLTVITSSSHGLAAGDRISIYGVTSDSRMNYPAIVVATVANTTSFTVTAGPGGTITSLTVGPYTSQGFVAIRPALKYAADGVAEVWENASATNATLIARQAGNSSYPGGTIIGNQSSTTGTTASVQPAATSYGTYGFTPTTEFRIIKQAERLAWLDNGVDGTNTATNRLSRTQVIPDITKRYNLRFRFNNNKSFPIPVAQIVSCSKSGTTTATFNTNVAHGLTTGDFVNIFGVYNQTDFPNQATAIAVASTPSSTSFTAVITATTPTTTSYGGFVSRAQGSTGQQNAQALAISTATLSGGVLTLVGSASWTAVAGDYVNVFGCRNIVDGTTLGVDGAYKVIYVSTTTLVLSPIGSTTVPADFTVTSAGGGVLKRTDARIHFTKMLKYARERVEVHGGASLNVPVQVIAQSGTVTTVTTVTTVGTSSAAINTLVNDITSAALTTVGTTTAAAITPASGAISHEFNVIVTAVSGTTPTMDVVVQESDDSGTNWYDVYHFPRITATGQYRSPLIPLTGNRIRYLRIVGGTSPSFTNAVNRLQSHHTAPLQRQFVDRTINVNTLNSTTNTYFTDGASEHNIIVNMGAITTTAPVFQTEASFDSSNWYPIGNTITASASNTVALFVGSTQARFLRVRASTAGSGATAGYIAIKSK